MARVLAALLALVVPFVSADTCSSVQTAAPSVQVSYPLSLAYTSHSKDYWSTTCAALKPTCILFPSSAAEVAAIVDILKTNTDRFAIKSGGHNPNDYFASIQGGPLISTSKLNHLLLDQQTGIVRLGPGHRWDEVAEALDGSGWGVVGGRVGNVGVGGYLLGGGLSFQSAEHGWAANNILSYEVVLADGSIVTASPTSNPDLFRALKGGGNNFGIVTSFTVQAHPQENDVWGGMLSIPSTPSNDEKILQAIHDFTHNADPKAAIVPTKELVLLNLVEIWVFLIYYNGPDPGDVFKPFTSLFPTVNTCHRQSMVSLVKANNAIVLKGVAYIISTESLPLPKPSETGSGPSSMDLLRQVNDIFEAKMRSVILVPDLIASLGLQPYSKSFAQKAIDKGGDLIAMDADVDRILIVVNTSFALHAHYNVVAAAVKAFYDAVRQLVLDLIGDGFVDGDTYLPLFANDGFFQQDYWGRLKPASRALAQSVAADVDPTGFFRDRTGGWKP